MIMNGPSTVSRMIASIVGICLLTATTTIIPTCQGAAFVRQTVPTLSTNTLRSFNRSSSTMQRVAAADAPTLSATNDDNTDNASTLRSMTFSNLRKDQEPQLLCDLLMEIGACSTAITDADKDTDREEAIFVEPNPNVAAIVWEDAAVGRNVWNRCHVTAHFPDSVDLPGVVDLVEAVLDLSLDPTGTVQVVPNKDWVIHVQQSWKPIRIGNIVLRFPWHTNEDVQETWEGGVKVAEGDESLTVATMKDNDRVELQLEGGVAFGTGEHPTTQLCLEWIQREIGKDQMKNNNDTDDDDDDNG